ncbi:MAG: hypothetical protein R2710_19770 [Acidimicrobiales bacterium]
MVQAQLLLLPTDTTWRLDPSTRRIGREGIAAACAALAAASHTDANSNNAASPAPHEHTLAA